MMRWAKRLLLATTLLGLLATNILTLTSKAFNAALSGALYTATGISTVSNMMQSRIERQNKAIAKQKSSATKMRSQIASQDKTIAQQKSSATKMRSQIETQNKTIAKQKSSATKMRSKIASQTKTIAKQKFSARRFGTRLASRVKRVAAKSIAAIPAEAIPLIGVPLLIADTGYELYAACETVNELDQLYSDLEMTDELPEDVMHSVCAPELPNPEEVWDDVVEKSGEWSGQLLKAISP